MLKKTETALKSRQQVVFLEKKRGGNHSEGGQGIGVYMFWSHSGLRAVPVMPISLSSAIAFQNQHACLDHINYTR
jgi:hypothetical protein